MRAAVFDHDRWDTGRVWSLDIVGMPMLEQHVRALPDTLTGIDVLYVNHAISDSLMVARGLRRLGARLTSVLVPYHGQVGPTRRAIAQAFAALGDSCHPRPAGPRDFTDVMRTVIHTAIDQVGRRAAHEHQRWMIVEDGGYAFPALHDAPSLQRHLDTCLGAVEHTTRGRWNYEYTEQDGVPRTARILRRPAVTISGSALKTAHEGRFVAHALVDECCWLLRRDHQFLRHRTVAVCGYGRVGRALAEALSALDVHVLVVDPDKPTLDARHQPAGLTEAISAGAFLVFGATGVSSFTPEALAAFVQDSSAEILYLASASSKTVEFAELTTLLDHAATSPDPSQVIDGVTQVTVRPDHDIGLRYRIRRDDGAHKDLVVLASGYPVIFYPPDTHGVPNRAMDPVMTQLFLAAAGLPSAATSLPSRVHTIDDLRKRAPRSLPPAWRALVDEDALLRDWCMANHIDFDTYRTSVRFAPINPEEPQ